MEKVMVWVLFSVGENRHIVYSGGAPIWYRRWISLAGYQCRLNASCMMLARLIKPYVDLSSLFARFYIDLNFTAQ